MLIYREFQQLDVLAVFQKLQLFTKELFKEFTNLVHGIIRFCLFW